MPRERPSRQEAVAQAIEREQALISRLGTELEEARKRLDGLRSDLASIAPRPEIRINLAPQPLASIPETPAEKVSLFRRLFRGREDVFAIRFVTKTGRPGYAPECANKFVRGICELPRVKCGECPNQAFHPVSDAIVVGHLQGRHVMGVYPLLKDETCWFVAADFDKTTWVEDVTAFAETCRQVGVPAAIERSRSGNGAHAWFFFNEPVSAGLARRMACYLITETMSRRHELGMDSYDRLFPSQDTLPRGGFGNLIALPLQHAPRQEGNSIFLDERLAAIPNEQQWAYLASVQRIDRRVAEGIAAEATRRGSVIGVRLSDVTDEEDEAPWAVPPSGRSRPTPVAGPLPERVRAVIAHRLFVEKAGLPSTLLNRIKRLAAFQNPEFYKKQSLRLSTAMTPRVIACAEDHALHVSLPRGCMEGLSRLLCDHGVALDLEDQRSSGRPLDVTFRGDLTPVQKQAIEALLAHDIGLCVLPPGAGKTVLGTYLVAARRTSTLVLVHRRPLLDQWREQLSLFLGIQRSAVGQVGAGKSVPNGELDVAMIQSLVRRGTVQDLVERYGQVIVDECHHVPAASFERVLAEVKARYIVGLTATPRRRDGHDPILGMQLGPVRFATDPKAEAARRPFDHRLLVRETGFCLAEGAAGLGIQELYAALASDSKRNQLIVDDVRHALEAGRSPILLTERREHLEYLKDRLAGHARHTVVLQGGMSRREVRMARELLASIPREEGRLILATGRYIGEGFDDARLDVLFLALPVSWKGTLVQYTGRLHRQNAAKREVLVFDYLDRDVPMLRRMFERRLRGYRALGYSLEGTLDRHGSS